MAECDASRDGAVAEAPNRTPALAKKSLAKERRHHEMATQKKALAYEANKQRWAAARDKALADEANERRQTAARQKALAEDKWRQEERGAIRRIRVQCALLAAPLDAILAEIERDYIAHEANERQRATTRDKALADEANDLRQVATVREKALADEAYERRLAATREKAMADEVNKRRCHVTAARENALANNAYEQRYQESANVSPPPHRPTTYKDVVLSTMGRSLRAKPLVVAPLSRPSTTVDGQLQTACCRSQPRRRVGRRPTGSQSTGAPSLWSAT